VFKFSFAQDDRKHTQYAINTRTIAVIVAKRKIKGKWKRIRKNYINAASNQNEKIRVLPKVKQDQTGLSTST